MEETLAENPDGGMVLVSHIMLDFSLSGASETAQKMTKKIMRDKVNFARLAVV
jgi:hypothetical protein